jgi:hypothetical protein
VVLHLGEYSQLNSYMKPLVQYQNAKSHHWPIFSKLSSLWHNILKNMREYMRVPIPVPTGVLLCAYKLGFGLVQNLLEKIQNSLCLGSTDYLVCTEHCIVQCPVHRLGARGSATVQPCSVVHRTMIVCCPVCIGQALYTVRCAQEAFLNNLLLLASEARPSLLSLTLYSVSLCGGLSAPPAFPHRWLASACCPLSSSCSPLPW